MGYRPFCWSGQFLGRDYPNSTKATIFYVNYLHSDTETENGVFHRIFMGRLRGRSFFVEKCTENRFTFFWWNWSTVLLFYLCPSVLWTWSLRIPKWTVRLDRGASERSRVPGEADRNTLATVGASGTLQGSLYTVKNYWALQRNAPSTQIGVRS